MLMYLQDWVTALRCSLCTLLLIIQMLNSISDCIFFHCCTKVFDTKWKSCLKLNIEKTDPVPSSPITSWQIEGERVEAVTDFLFLGSKITVDSDCRHEIKRYLLLGRKAMTNLNSKFKSKDIILLTKVYLVKAMAFLVGMNGCESWTVKKAEH